MTFDQWVKDNEEAIYDTTGGDWDDLIGILREAFKVGYLLGHDTGYKDCQR